MPGGGSGGGGGAVVGGPSPFGAMLAGQYQSQAAQAASDAAQEAISSAINSINRQYQQARYDVQPYRTTGVQALDQLNQYMGLDPYNPGAAPNAPVKKTAEDFLDQINKSQVNNYITQNTSWVPSTNKGGQSWLHPYYMGEGVDENTPGWRPATTGSDGGYYMAGVMGPGQIGQGKDISGLGASGYFMGQPAIVEAARRALANEKATQANMSFDVDMEAYNRNLEEYNQNKAWYDKYKAEGPLSSSQVTDRITNLPGYQAELGQGINAIQKAAGAGGYLGSGRVLKELTNFGQGTLSKFYGSELSRLAALAGGGQNAATTSAGASMGLGGNMAGLYSTLGDIKANSSLAGGQALANAILAANQQYKVIGGSDGGGGWGGLGSVLGGIGGLMGSSSTGASGLGMFL
jgi:hypothetical protein